MLTTVIESFTKYIDHIAHTMVLLELSSDLTANLASYENYI